MDPVTQDKAASIAWLGEKQLLKHIREWLGDTAPPSPAGMGDDCAVLGESSAGYRLITTDSLVLGRHFTAETDPASAGGKLLRRNLSDIAAMGGTPTQAVVAGFLPSTLRVDWLQAFVEGIAATARSHGVEIVGGDLTESSGELAFNLTLLGEATNPLCRHGGQVGDWICVTGKLGGSREGRHLVFTPRLAEGRLLAASPSVHACIDISDGLAIDLLQLLPGEASAELRMEAIPVHPDAGIAAQADGRSALWHALNDGEDHELLFLMQPLEEPQWAAFRQQFLESGALEVTRIGRVIPAGAGPLVAAGSGEAIDFKGGYDHFR